MTAPYLQSKSVKIICAIMLIIALWFGSLGAMTLQSSDLYAVWMAASAMAQGLNDQVYFVSDTVFAMQSDPRWMDRIVAQDGIEDIFPYLYPPLWAAITSWLTSVMSFPTFNSLFFVFQQGLFVWMILLAARMCSVTPPAQLIFVTLTYVALVSNPLFFIGLAQNQPQILVSFLIVAAFERAQAGHPRTAGALLALAASIKLYPLYFIALFIGAGNVRALIAFIVAGAALALTSIGLAGWPLHSEYLDLIARVSTSVIITNLTFTFDSVLATFMFKNDLIAVQPVFFEGTSNGWFTLDKGDVWHLVSTGAQILTVAALGWRARYAPDPLLLPIAVIAIAWFSPLSWPYTYLPALVFVGAIATRGGRVGSIFVALVAIAMNTYLFKSFLTTTATSLTDPAFTLNLEVAWIMGTLMTALIAAAFLGIALRKPPATP